MTVCGRCVKQYGYEHEKVANIHVVATDRIEEIVYWFGVCDECGGWTDPCLTPIEVRERINKGLYNHKAIKLSNEQTCKNEDDDCDSWFKCSECGLHSHLEIMSDGYDIPNYCPGCGAKVVD